MSKKMKKITTLEIELISITNRKIINSFKALDSNAKLSKIFKEELKITGRCTKVFVKYLWVNKTLNIKRYIRWSLETINEASKKGLIMYY